MNQHEALNSRPLFTFPNGETVHVWISDQPISVFAQARSGGAQVTVGLVNCEDGVELGDTEQTMVGGHRPGEWAKLHALAYATASLFDDTGAGMADDPAVDYLVFNRLVTRLNRLRSVDPATVLFGQFNIE